MLADFVDGADVGMVQGRSGRASRRKRARACGSLGYFIRQEFQGDKATEPVSSAL